MDPIPFHILEQITNEFSSERKIGSGGYGEVYKGVYENGTEIAVKRLYEIANLDDVKFLNELSNVIRINHRNIVRIVGYCHEAKSKIFDHNGDLIFGKYVNKIICFEYMDGGSLDKHITEESRGLDWRARYKIIKGICEGLNYLHKGLEKPIFHLDLKPANILLDKNMTPKIADFGLSRLFGGTHTHTTNSLTGTIHYMPPEFITKHHISDKYDIFSLGVIIIEIMTGPKSFSDILGDMKKEDFIDHVHSNWRKRIEATSAYPRDELDQVDICLKIAIKCVDPEKKHRPTIVSIIDMLNWTSAMVQAWITKVGPWGGNSGYRKDIKVTPRRLVSVIVRCGEVIHSLAFSYSDENGQQHSAGPWGTFGFRGHDDDRFHTIQLGPSEFLLNVSGTVGLCAKYSVDVVTSLEFVTNKGNYGPFGGGEGIPFSCPVKTNGSNIVGFFAHAGEYVDAVGVYVNSMQENVLIQQAWPLKIGPWGGHSGSLHDIQVTPRCLKSITIRSREVIISLAFSYSDNYGQQHHAGPWGAYGGCCDGRFDTIKLDHSEFLVQVSGTIGLSSEYFVDVVTSLTFMTNCRSYGPFGTASGTPFCTPMQKNGSIVGFFAHTGAYVDSIGVYVNNEMETTKEEALISKIGPWGGNSGWPHDIGVLPRRLISIVVCSGKVINSLTFTYSDHDEKQYTAGPWGALGGSHEGGFDTILLDPSETLKEVSGTVGPSTEFPYVITSLSFVTNAASYGPFGEGGGTPFCSQTKSDGSIVGFFAHAGAHLDAIGVYVR